MPPKVILPAGEEEVWYTGTLLSPFGYTIPPGFINVEPTLFVTQNFGAYDEEWHAHATSKFLTAHPLLSLIVGMTKNIDFQITPEAFYNRSRGKASLHFGDLSAGFDFQLFSEKKGKWWPAIKFILTETFPTGKYQHLDPHKNETDSTGGGSYVTTAGLVFSRAFHFSNYRFLHLYLTFEYLIPSNVHVKGFNTYGGAFGTRGTVHPGNIFETILSMELGLARNWVFALDIQNIYGNKITFSGRRGAFKDGSPAKVGGPSFDQLSLAPAIEYNWSQNFGLIAGAWFTVAGRNTNQFAGGAIALNWYLPTTKKIPLRASSLMPDLKDPN